MTEHNGASIEDSGGGRFTVRGELTFETAASLLTTSTPLFQAAKRITVDMSEVVNADSGGLALLIEWLAWAKSHGRAIRYESIPQQLLAIGEICEVTDLLRQAASYGESENSSSTYSSANSSSTAGGSPS